MTEQANIVVKSELDICIEDVSHAVAEITQMDAVIGELEQQFSNVIIDVSTSEGMKVAKAARAKIRKPRYLIERLRKAGKAPVLELGRKLDGKATEQKDRLLALENPIHDDITEEEQREEREREARIKAEEERVQKIKTRIEDIRCAAEPIAWDTDARDITIVIAQVEKIEIDDSFEEFRDEAQDAKDAMLMRLRALRSAATDREADEARRKAEQEELEMLRAAEERRRAIRQRIEELRGIPAHTGLQPSGVILRDISEVEEIEIDASYDEFTEEANAAKSAKLSKLRELHDVAAEREQEEARRRADIEREEKAIAEERARIEAERSQLEHERSKRDEVNLDVAERRYEVACRQLAEILLPDGPREAIDSLSQGIQNAVEEWFDFDPLSPECEITEAL